MNCFKCGKYLKPYPVNARHDYYHCANNHNSWSFLVRCNSSIIDTYDIVFEYLTLKYVLSGTCLSTTVISMNREQISKFPSFYEIKMSDLPNIDKICIRLLKSSHFL